MLFIRSFSFVPSLFLESVVCTTTNVETEVVDSINGMRNNQTKDALDIIFFYFFLSFSSLPHYWNQWFAQKLTLKQAVDSSACPSIIFFLIRVINSGHQVGSGRTGGELSTLLTSVHKDRDATAVVCIGLSCLILDTTCQ